MPTFAFTTEPAGKVSAIPPSPVTHGHCPVHLDDAVNALSNYIA